MTSTSWLKSAGDHLDSLLAAQRLDEAEAVARQCLGDPDLEIRGLIALARCESARGHVGPAIAWAERAVRICPGDHSLGSLLGALLVADGRMAQARSRLSAVIATTPVAMPRLALIQAALVENDLEPAADLLAQLLATLPVSTAPHMVALADTLVSKAGLPGWVGGDQDRRVVGALRLTPACARQQLLITASDHDGLRTLVDEPFDQFAARFGAKGETTASLIRFSLSIAADAASAADNDDIQIDIRLDGTPLFGAPFSLPKRIPAEGAVLIEGNRLTGWAWLPTDAQSPAVVRISDCAGHAITLTPDQPFEDAVRLGLDAGNPGFVCDLAMSALVPGWLTVTAGPEATPLVGSPLAWPDRAGTGTTAAPGISGRLRPSAPQAISPAPMVDIIVPVYRGISETLACLASVIATTPRDIAEIVVVNDASPEPALTAALRDLAAHGAITLLENERNLGFPATVNRGMACHVDRDVVLLNADTLVAGDWLGRLRRAAYAAPDIGSATPFSNDATILSYPGDEEKKSPPAKKKAPTPIPDLGQTQALHHAAASANSGVIVDLPTAVAFCTYFRRDCLAETGLFDAVAFARGYGEENDFCLRARGLGWRHVAATDAFVAHVGGRSFGRDKAVLTWRNIRVLNRRYPGYDALIADFIDKDPLAGARRNIDLARWAAEPALPSILLITLDLGGGVSRHVEERRTHLATEGLRTLVLEPFDIDEEKVPERCRLTVPGRDDLRNLVFRTADEFDDLIALLRRAGVVRVEIHHAHNHDPLVLEIPGRLAVPYDVIVHDYSWICPRITMIGLSDRYCGEPDLEVCELCAIQPGVRLKEAISVAALRQRTGSLLANARTVVAPSRDVVERLRRFFPNVAVHARDWDGVRPAPVARPQRPPDQRWRVCLIGGIGEHKGSRRLLACARDAVLRQLPLEFVVVGFTDLDGPLQATGRVFITGRFSESEALALVKAQDAHLAFLPSICPETWSYTLSTAWQAGLAAVAFDLGAIAERIRQHNGGYVLADTLSAPAINDALLAILDQTALSGVAIVTKATTATGSGVAGDDLCQVAHEHPVASRTPEETTLMFGSTLTPPPAPVQHPTMAVPAAPAAIPVPASTTALQGDPITASVQKVQFKTGVFSVVVVGGGGTIVPGEFPPACVQLAVAPNNPVGAKVTLISSRDGGWLCQAGDVLVLKVEGEMACTVLTAYRNNALPGEALKIQMARLDAAPEIAPAMVAAPAPVALQTAAPTVTAPAIGGVAPGAPAMPPSPFPVAPAIPMGTATYAATATPRVDIVLFSQRTGDVRFTDGGWAGEVGKRMPIEAFVLTPTAGLTTADIEYKALTANGYETPWLPGGEVCGNRGAGTALVGFAIRLRGAAAERFECLYEGAFTSGFRTLTLRNGAPCRSDVIGDPLEGLLLRIVAKGSV